MKKLLNTVYVTTEGAALRRDGENLVAEVDGAPKARVPLHMLASVVIFGPVFVSPALIWAGARFLETASSATFPRNGGRAWTTRAT